MPTIISHPAMLMALHPVFQKIPSPRTVFLLGAVCSVLPDLDVIGFGFGIRYGGLLGHRGLSHSIVFAAMIAGSITVYLAANHIWPIRFRLRVFAFLFFCTVSHGILDALTDGGLGVAFFSPFSNQRYFFPWRPLKVSPIGIDAFFSGSAWKVLKSELFVLWLPGTIIFITGIMLRLNKKGRRLHA